MYTHINVCLNAYKIWISMYSIASFSLQCTFYYNGNSIIYFQFFLIERHLGPFQSEAITNSTR